MAETEGVGAQGVPRAGSDPRTRRRDPATLRWIASSPRAAVVVVPVLALAALLPLFRQTGARSWDTIWAEDGWIYFQQAHDHGLSVVFRGYAGYLQLPDRLLAAPSALVPVGEVALYFALVSTIVGALLAWFVYWASAGWVDSQAARIALASLVVLMPALGQENTATVTNTIWILAAVTPWAFVSRSDGGRAVVLRSTIAFLAATATLISLVFLPLALGMAAIRRNRASAFVGIAYLAGVAVQFGVTSTTSDHRRLRATRDLSKLPEIVGVRGFDQFLLSDRGINAIWDQRILLVVFIPALVAGGLLVAMFFVSRHRRILSLVFLGVGLASLLVPLLGRGTSSAAIAFPSVSFLGPVVSAGRYQPNPARYSVIPVFMLASAAVVLLTSLRTSRAWLPRASTAAFVALLVVPIVVGFRVTNARSGGPAWSATVAAQRGRCAHRSPDSRARLRLPVPAFNPAVVVRCRDL
ncbi:MAG: hypothetical protein QOF59_600 [Actinomycetota bacterium]|nr:hypothetical protein [Actinomycetota bacterium]